MAFSGLVEIASGNGHARSRDLPRYAVSIGWRRLIGISLN
jgi:hypothetical protein